MLGGTAYGHTAPTGVLSPTLSVHATTADDATLAVDDVQAEHAVYGSMVSSSAMGRRSMRRR